MALPQRLTAPAFKILKTKIFGKRAIWLSKTILPYINEAEKILDFGCGTLTVAEEIAKTKKVQIEGIDVIDFNLTNLPLSIYDGKTTNFKDKIFDTTYATFALHHCDNVEVTFAEILRITRKKIILIEDTYESQFELFGIRFLDYIENRIGSRKMNIPFNFKSEVEWISFFQAHNITKIRSQVLNPSSIRKHILFVLDLISTPTP